MTAMGIKAGDEFKVTNFADGTVAIHVRSGKSWLEVAVLKGRFALQNAQTIVAALGEKP